MQALGTPFRRLIGAAAAANLGDGLLLVGAPLLALQVTREPVLVAGVQVAFMLPFLLLGLQAGALADRRSRRGLLVGSALMRAVVLAAVGIAALTGALSLWLLYVAVFVVGTGEVLYDTTSQSLVPDLVSTDDLGVANGRLVAVQTVMNNFIGAPLAGVLVVVSASAVLVGPAALHLLAVVLLLRLPSAYQPPARPPATMRTDIGEGLRALWHDGTLRAVASMAGILNLGNAAFSAVIVLFVVGEASPMGLPEWAFGLLAAVMAAGAVVGSLVVADVERVLGPRRTLLGGVLAMGLLAGLPAVTTAVMPIAGLAFGLGFLVTLVNVVSVSSRQRRTPPALLGRVNAVFRLVATGAMPLGAAIGGVIASVHGLRATFVFVVVVQVLAVAVFQRPITDEALRTPMSEQELVPA